LPALSAVYEIFLTQNIGRFNCLSRLGLYET